MTQKDHTSLGRKVALRNNLLSDLRKMGAEPVVMETHAGKGAIFVRCYASIVDGVALERNQEKTEHLAWQRPTWSVYEGDSERMLAAGVGRHLPINFLDLDPYGASWPCLRAFFDSDRPFPPVMALAVNDGLRGGIKMTGWRHLEPIIGVPLCQRDAYERYLEVCQALVGQISGAQGYKIERWAGYYCGHNHDVTHYAAILRREP